MTCFKVSFLVDHVFLSSTLYFQNFYLLREWLPNQEKNTVGIVIVKELPQLFINYINGFSFPQKNNKAKSEKMDVSILMKSSQQILFSPLSHLAPAKYFL